MLNGWSDFFTLTGTAGGTLVGLLFIVASVILFCGGAGLLAGKPFAPFAIAGLTALFLVSGIYRTWGETLALIELSDKS